MSITPDVPVKRVIRDVIKQLVVLYKESHLCQRTPAYGGMKSIYTAGPLPFESKEFLVKLPRSKRYNYFRMRVQCLCVLFSSLYVFLVIAVF